MNEWASIEPKIVLRTLTRKSRIWRSPGLNLGLESSILLSKFRNVYPLLSRGTFHLSRLLLYHQKRFYFFTLVYICNLYHNKESGLDLLLGVLRLWLVQFLTWSYASAYYSATSYILYVNSDNLTSHMTQNPWEQRDTSPGIIDSPEGNSSLFEGKERVHR